MDTETGQLGEKIRLTLVTTNQGHTYAHPAPGRRQMRLLERQAQQSAAKDFPSRETDRSG